MNRTNIEILRSCFERIAIRNTNYRFQTSEEMEQSLNIRLMSSNFLRNKNSINKIQWLWSCKPSKSRHSFQYKIDAIMSGSKRRLFLFHSNNVYKHFTIILVTQQDFVKVRYLFNTLWQLESLTDWIELALNSSQENRLQIEEQKSVPKISPLVSPQLPDSILGNNDT